VPVNDLSGWVHANHIHIVGDNIEGLLVITTGILLATLDFSFHITAQEFTVPLKDQINLACARAILINLSTCFPGLELHIILPVVAFAVYISACLPK